MAVSIMPFGVAVCGVFYASFLALKKIEQTR